MQTSTFNGEVILHVHELVALWPAAIGTVVTWDSQLGFCPLVYSLIHNVWNCVANMGAHVQKWCSEQCDRELDGSGPPLFVTPVLHCWLTSPAPCLEPAGLLKLWTLSSWLPDFLLILYRVVQHSVYCLFLTRLFSWPEFHWDAPVTLPGFCSWHWDCLILCAFAWK